MEANEGVGRVVGVSVFSSMKTLDGSNVGDCVGPLVFSPFEERLKEGPRLGDWEDEAFLVAFADT
jgi:hypothetical protein